MGHPNGICACAAGRRPLVPTVLAHSAYQPPSLWALALAAGATNVGFNWAYTTGDVIRVILLFYTMPAWAVLLAWWLLGERPTPAALFRLVIAFAGLWARAVDAGVGVARASKRRRCAGTRCGLHVRLEQRPAATRSQPRHRCPGFSHVFRRCFPEHTGRIWWLQLRVVRGS